MAMPRRNLNGPAGDSFAHLHACTLAGYTAAGTTTPVVGDAVTLDATGDWYVERAADNLSKRLGEVTKIELAPAGTAVGYVVVEWYDAIRVVSITTDDASTVTLLNSLIKDGDTSVADNFDGGATTGPIVCVSKGGLGASAAGEVFGMVFGA